MPGPVDALEDAPMYEAELKLMGIEVTVPYLSSLRLREYRNPEKDMLHYIAVTLRKDGTITVWDIGYERLDYSGWEETFSFIRGRLLGL